GESRDRHLVSPRGRRAARDAARAVRLPDTRRADEGLLADRSNPHRGRFDTCVGMARRICPGMRPLARGSRRHRTCNGLPHKLLAGAVAMHELDSFAIVRNLELLLDQLYYWAQRARESRRTPDDAGVAGRMLQIATANLEAFATTLLEC